MQIQELLSPARCLAQVEATSKKRVLELLATTISEDIDHLNAENVFLSLVNRERLGSTGIGLGIAIPHARITHCSSPSGALITLSQPIEFDAIDSQPVDIIFAMLVPEDSNSEHLQALASLAAALNDEQYRNRLRAATHSRELFDAAHFD